MNFKNYFLIICFIIFSYSSSYSQEYNYEQIALQYFLSNFWNEKLFEEECTGLTFNKNFSIDVYDSSFQNVFCQLYSGLILGYINDSLTPREKDKYCEDFKKGKSDIIKLDLNLDIDTKLKFSSVREPPHSSEFIFEDSAGHFVLKQKVFNSYLLRFSHRYKFNGFTFIELWIKENYFTSGVNILLKFKNDEIIEYKKKYLCDLWG